MGLFNRNKNRRRIKECRERLENCSAVLVNSRDKIALILEQYNTAENKSSIEPIKVLIENLNRLEGYLGDIMNEIKRVELSKDIEKVSQDKIDLIVGQGDEMSLTALQAVRSSISAFSPDTDAENS